MGITGFCLSFVALERRRILNVWRFNSKTTAKILILLLLGSFGFFLLEPSGLGNLVPESSLVWILDGFTQIGTVLSGNTPEEGSVGVLLNHHIHYPDNLESFLFGQAEYIFGNRLTSVSSDIGYTRILFYGGLIYSLILYFTFGLLFWKAFSKSRSKLVRGVVIGGSFLCFIANVKGLVFSSNHFIKGMVLLCFFILFDSSKQKY